MLSQICFQTVIAKEMLHHWWFRSIKIFGARFEKTHAVRSSKKAYCGSNGLIEKRCLDKYNIETICIKHKKKTKVNSKYKAKIY